MEFTSTKEIVDRLIQIPVLLYDNTLDRENTIRDEARANSSVYSKLTQLHDLLKFSEQSLELLLVR